ncbi:MAG TPA: diaminopimelate epimerase [Methanosarcinaceae archaeon]|nr:diaminopimelate epimerase [Methanosarcinaceae archaeon]
MIEFTKLHGNGNDFIVINEFGKNIIPDDKKADFAVKYCNRRFGIGADGVLFISGSNKADMKMRLFQPDASEAEMCGNGIRCLVKYAFDSGHINVSTAMVETLAGVLPAETRRDNTGFWVRVNMGPPLTTRAEIPAKGDACDEFINVDMYGYTVSAINTGVPHAVIFVDDLDLDILEIAPKIRFDPIFPNGVNVNFVKVESDNMITIRTYERGVEDETLSCGTGSVACAYLAHKLKSIADEILVHTNGGVLNISISDDVTFMEGPAETVFKGTIPR